MGPPFTKWTPYCIEEALKQAIKNTENVYGGNKSEVGSFSHLCNWISFCNQKIHPLPAVRKIADLAHHLGYVQLL